MSRACAILIVEDQADARTAMSRILTQCGHQVCTAGTIAQARAQLDGQDVVVLDMMLPDESGISLLRQIREERRPAKVAVVTASDDLAKAALEHSPEAIFMKPINLSELLAWLERFGAATGDPTDPRS